MAVQIALRGKRGEKYSVIAKNYGVSQGAVNGIINGRNWKDAHITAAFFFDLEQEESKPS
jgi:hypothetical protein